MFNSAETGLFAIAAAMSGFVRFGTAAADAERDQRRYTLSVTIFGGRTIGRQSAGPENRGAYVGSRAIAADPGFALAHASRAHALLERGDATAARASMSAANSIIANRSAREASFIVPGATAFTWIPRFAYRRTWFVGDSPLEEEGFEPSVPRKKDSPFRDCPKRNAPASKSASTQALGGS